MNIPSSGRASCRSFIFVATAIIFHIALRYTKYGKYTYAIGGNMQAARVSGINVTVIWSSSTPLRDCSPAWAESSPPHAPSALRPPWASSYELDAIAAAVIGGTSLSGGLGTIGGAVVGTLILGVMISGFTFLGVDAYIQDIVKGVIIVAAVTADQYRQRKRRKV